MPKYKTLKESKITLYHNSITHSSSTTLFFLVNHYNYSLYTEESIGRQISALQNLIMNIDNLFSTVRFSIMRFQDIMSPREYIKSFTDTVRLWDEDFEPSEQFLKDIQYMSQNYSLLAINIDGEKSIDLNKMSVSKILKDYKKGLVDFFASFKQQIVDKEAIDELSLQITNVGRGLIKPCPEDILLRFYLKRIFPSFNLVVDKDEKERAKTILGHLNQDYITHFNYFKMSNTGVELFGAMARETYGSVLDIIEMPENISSENFSLSHDWFVCNAKTLTKQKALLKVRRKKRDIEFEEEGADVAGAIETALDIEDYKDIADTALSAISLGRPTCESDMHILVLADTLEELNEKRASLLSRLKNMDIIATFSSNQGKTYIDSFVKLRPPAYPFFSELRYPLSFRFNEGSLAGDFDGEYTSSVLAETVTRGEACDS